MATSRSGGIRRHTHRVAGEPAYVLHRYDWSESSLILDLFTREHGRLAVVAKGAKRPYSQLRAVLLPFQRLVVGYSSRDEEGAEVYTLKSAEWAGGHAMLSGPSVLTGFYLNELLMRLLARSDAHPGLFDAYAATLPALLPGAEAQVAPALRAFELTLLREIGVLPELDVETLTQTPVDPGGRYRLQPEAGVAAAQEDGPSLPGSVLRALEQALEAGSLDHLVAVCATAPELRAAMRPVLHYHLGSPVLRTRQLMMELPAK